MPIFQKIVDFDKLITTLREPPVIINDLNNDSQEDKEYIKSIICTRYNTDMFSLLPSCQCGHTKGEFASGITCPECGTLVKSDVESSIEPNVWFRRPAGVHKLISPIILIMLKNKFKKSGFNIIQWIIDGGYSPKVRQPDVIDKIQKMGIQRGYNYFVDNFDSILSSLFSIREFTKQPDTPALKELLELNRNKIFFDYIPLPNKSLMIIENTNVGTYIDNSILDALDICYTITSIDKHFYDQTQRVKENRTGKALCRLADFYEGYYKKSISPKQGQFRRHIYGSRTNFAFRAVISSITNSHDFDKIYVPWGVGLTAFKFHVLNKLLKKGMDLNSATGLLLGHIEKYHPELDNILKELIAEAPNGITCIIQRN